MPEAKPDKAFTDFLKTAPSAADLAAGRTTLATGTVYRAEDADSFVLATADGQTAELPVDAVVRHKVIDASGLNAISQLELVAAKIAGRITLKELIKDPVKEVPKDLIKDPIHKELPKDLIKDPGHKELPKDVIKDPGHKELPKDVIKEPVKEPIFDPPGTLWNDPPGGTLQEQIDPGQFGGIDPVATRAAAAGMTPFIMATPHHAPQASVMQQQLAAGPAAALGATPHTVKELITDHVADQIMTKKELTKDPILDTRKELAKDPILDTRKEMVWDTYKEAAGDTWVEQGFDPSGGAVNPPSWNLPGMMW